MNSLPFKRSLLPVRAYALALAALLSVPWVGPAVAQEQVGLTEQELTIWNDAGFRQRFVESYIAQSDVEPKPVSQEEVEAINQTLELMRADKLEEALAKAVEAREKAKVQEEPKKDSRGRSSDKDQKNQGGGEMSALMDFLIANIQLNIAMNLAEPGESATEQERESYTIKRNKFLADAADGYRLATTRHPKYLRAWRNLGIVYLRLADYKGARDAFVKVVSIGGADADIFGLMGYCNTQLGSYLSAESAYRMANLMQPEKKDWQMGLLRSFLMQKRYPEVVAMAGSMIEDDPTNDQLWFFQANAYIGMQQIDKAAENYEILDGMGKSTAPSMNMLANIYTNQGLFDTAVERYAKAIALADETQLASMKSQMLSAAQVLANRGEEARSASKSMIALVESTYKESLADKDRTTLLRLKARIALSEGADDAQASILEEVVAIDPLDGEALILLGQHYARLQDWDKAVNFYERAQKLERFEADALVYHAQALVLSDRASLAVPLLRKAQQVKPRESVQSYLEAVERMK